MSSADYYVKHLAVDLPLATADKIADVTLATGRAAGMLPLTVVVLDAGGHLLTLQRDGGRPLSAADYLNARPLTAEVMRGTAANASGCVGMLSVRAYSASAQVT